MRGLHFACVVNPTSLTVKKTEIQDITSSHAEAASQGDLTSGYSGQSSKNFIPDGSKVYYSINISNE